MVRSRTSGNWFPVVWNEFSLFFFFIFLPQEKKKKKKRRRKSVETVNGMVMNREVKARYYLDTFSEPVEGIRWSWTSALSSNWRGRRRSGSFERSSCPASGIYRNKEWRTMEMGSLADLSTRCTRPPAPGHQQRHLTLRHTLFEMLFSLFFFLNFIRRIFVIKLLDYYWIFKRERRRKS